MNRVRRKRWHGHQNFFEYGRSYASRRYRVIVVVFEVVVLLVVLLHSTASWLERVVVFVIMQVITFASLEGLKAYYDPDD